MLIFQLEGKLVGPIARTDAGTKTGMQVPKTAVNAAALWRRGSFLSDKRPQRHRIQMLPVIDAKYGLSSTVDARICAHTTEECALWTIPKLRIVVFAWALETGSVVCSYTVDALYFTMNNLITGII